MRSAGRIKLGECALPVEEAQNTMALLVRPRLMRQLIYVWVVELHWSRSPKTPGASGRH